MSASDLHRFNTREWVLESETEYRFELDPGSSLAIKVRPWSRPTTRVTIYRKNLQVLKGHAEVFGAELADGKYYLFGHECKAAIFTWQGCTIEMSPPSFKFTLFRITEHRINLRVRHRNAVDGLCLRRDAHARIRECPSCPREDARARSERTPWFASASWTGARGRSGATTSPCPRARKLGQDDRVQNSYQLCGPCRPGMDTHVREYRSKRGVCVWFFQGLWGWVLMLVVSRVGGLFQVLSLQCR